jgi:CubicO group peptidase (beta-lactamase class C family)
MHTSASISSSLRRLPLRSLSLGLVALAGMPVSALAAATLYLVQGSGDMQSLQTSMSVTSQQSLTLDWSTDQSGAAGGTWTVVNAANQVVASGEDTPAPAPGAARRFSIPAGAFLATSVASNTSYKITIQPHDGVMVAKGTASAPVTVTQVPATSGGGIVFNGSANYPQVEIVSYVEKVGVVPFTQIHYAGADMVLSITNRSRAASDPAWLTVKDENLLMRQNVAPLAVPSLAAGASTTMTLHVDAILPAGTSQLPQDVQYNTWSQKNRDACGSVLRSVLDWRGTATSTPVDAHKEQYLVKQGWSDYATTSPNLPICKGTQCIKLCQVEKNIKAQLDGKVMGYSYYVGTFPKFGGGGYARSAADAPQTAFRSDVKIHVASVSKLVTAIATQRVMDRRSSYFPDRFDTPIANFLPSDWAPLSFEVRNMTIGQLLTHTSGIKDYGNTTLNYDKLKSFFSQSVDYTKNTSCQGPKAKNVVDPINSMNHDPCYSNYNFAILRLILPRLAGLAEDPNATTRGATLAKQYEQLVQQEVFNRVGQMGVSCKPPADSSKLALAYKSYGSTAKGSNSGDLTASCGAYGWHLSIEDMAKVMTSLMKQDGKILGNGSDRYYSMASRGYGLDVVNGKEYEKNGGWGMNCDANDVCDTISTSVAHFGDIIGPEVMTVLFMNSNVTGGGDARAVLEKAYKDALYTP